MSQIPTFGFSAFLKLINSNQKPQKRILRERFIPGEGGYDYHKSLKFRIRQIAFHGHSHEAVLASTNQITKSSERESAKRGLTRFHVWREANPGSLESCVPLTYASPKGHMRVSFTPEFLLEMNGRRTAVHIWNTQHALSINLVHAALCTVAARYSIDHRPDDFAVLSLQNGELYRWSDADTKIAALGEKLLDHLDTLCEVVRFELGLPMTSDQDSPRPAA